MPTERRSERARYRPAPPGIQMLELGSAGMLDVQVLPNIGQSSVTARGSMLKIGLLMNPMKWSKLWLPLRNPREPRPEPPSKYAGASSTTGLQTARGTGTGGIKPVVSGGVSAANA